MMKDNVCAEIQGKILEVYKEVVHILTINKLKYFAIGGTAIGAVRHKGFVPWDDDLDIAMPRKDYNRLIEILKKDIPNGYEMRTYTNTPNTNLKFLKIIDTGTTLIQKSLSKIERYDSGVFIDIFPIDGLPCNNIKFWWHKRCVFFLDDLIFKTRTEFNFNNLKNIIRSMRHPVVLLSKKIIKPRNLRSLFMNLIQKYDLDECKYFTFYHAQDMTKSIKLETDCLNDIIEMKFEDTTINMLANYDEYLTQHFGDYMKLPPISKQKPYHDFVVIDFDTSYKEYRKKFNYYG